MIPHPLHPLQAFFYDFLKNKKGYLYIGKLLKNGCNACMPVMKGIKGR